MDEQLADPIVIAGLQLEQLTPRLGRRQHEITPLLELTFPPQPIGRYVLPWTCCTRGARADGETLSPIAR